MPKFILTALLFAFIAVGAARADVDMTKPLDLKFTAIDGRQVDLAKLRGKVVIIDFWATWCPPCRAIAPDLVKLYKKFHSQGLEIVGVSVDSDLSGLAKVVKDEGLVWPQFCDGQGADNAIATKFDIQQFPTIFLLNKQGVVVNSNMTDLWAHDGTLDRVTTPATMQKVEAAIRQQLDAP